MHIAKWAVLLSIFWLLLSGMIKPLMLLFGVVSVVIVLVVVIRMDAVDKKSQDSGMGPRFIRYLPWLVGQIISASIQVTKLIWGSPAKLTPTVATINAADVAPSSRVLYANSITLTPGTLSMDLVDGEITVHALQKSSIEALNEGAMKKKITSIWGENQ